jgi:hypothetical protein
LWHPSCRPPDHFELLDLLWLSFRTSHLTGGMSDFIPTCAERWPGGPGWPGQQLDGGQGSPNLILYPFLHKSCHLRVYLIFRQTWLKSTLLCDTANFQTETRCCSLQVKIRSLRERWYHDTWHEWIRNVKTFSCGSAGTWGVWSFCLACVSRHNKTMRPHEKLVYRFVELNELQEKRNRQLASMEFKPPAHI